MFMPLLNIYMKWSTGKSLKSGMHAYFSLLGIDEMSHPGAQTLHLKTVWALTFTFCGEQMQKNLTANFDPKPLA